MAHTAPAQDRYTSQRYFDLVQSGILYPDDRVELLEGIIVAMSPQNPRYASATRRVSSALRNAIGQRAVISIQSPLVLGPYSVPEPDVALLPGHESDYDDAHPSSAFLVVEVADTSLLQDRLTKTAIYAAASVPEYWLVNLRDDCVEVFRTPEPKARTYSVNTTVHRDDRLEVMAFSGASLSVDDLLPGKP